ncbi:hypothetical protein SPRG_15353 [Saprolegnia parasitica CBS 223.65]|uniref:Dynactin subunit 4 n=1 Tax=Saprolegnia parasitica (strain CBS 223.65) TaxID=695850 RepID=A0A067BMK0_SAPPC|nr:hypothetical protein SPRG_15353 [Saprolegnia parasitica CBS 223.65]KDO19448.1 hypothetical protein SPRG_15353 [Saprolegnia parasitica CBS 223.65]|eukprot:XP_012209831.1 hypothetical protein SPRG_15353 [Saprolegnia parasitica CBS 223.65]
MPIRYACPCGRRYPLAELYWSDSCNKLVCPWPTCSLQEIDSYFCRFQMDNLPSKEAAAYKNRSARTFACPDCASTLQTIKTSDKYIFFCAHCRWDSEAILADDDPDTLTMVANTRERDDHVFDTLLSHYQQAFGKPHFQVKAPSTLGWKMEQLDEKLHKRSIDNVLSPTDQKLAAALRAKFPNHKSFDCADDDDAVVALASKKDMSTISTLHQRYRCNPLLQSRDVSALYPSRPDLRVKRSWRCVEAMAKNNPGILVKPQINPMTGDSSMVVSASWWKKATLGIHFVPNVTIQTLWANDHCWLLLENPLEDDVVLTVVAKALASDDAAPFTPAVPSGPLPVGAYEDPNLIDTSPAEVAKFDDVTSDPTKTVLTSRNYAKFKVQGANASDPVAFQLEFHMYKIEDEEHIGAVTSVDGRPLLAVFTIDVEIPRAARD